MAFVAGAVIAKFTSDMSALQSGINSAKSALSSLKDNAGNVRDAFEKTATSLDKTGNSLIAFGAAPAAALTLATKVAIDFESAFAGIRKTVDASEGEFKQLEKNIRGIAKEAPVSVVELSKIGEMAGQLGVRGVDNLTRFIDTVSKIAVSTNLTSEEAATSFARIANIMQEPIENIDRMASTVVDLGNNFATTESEIVEFANRIAGAGKIAGLTTADIFGIGAAMSSVGVQAEAGGTAVQKVLLDMNSAAIQGGESLEIFAKTSGLTAKEFQTLWGENATEAFVAFVAGLGKEGDNAMQILSDLGLEDQRLIRSFLSLANAGDLVFDTMSTASDAFRENTALVEEANKRYATTESQLKIFRNNLEDIGITLGSVLLPALNDLLTNLKPMIESFQSFSEANPKLLVSVLALGTAFLGLGIAMKGAAVVLNGMVGIMNTARLGFLLLGNAASLSMGLGMVKNVKDAGAAFSLLGGVIKGSLIPSLISGATAAWAFIAPFLPIIAIIAVVVGALALLYFAWTNNWGGIQEKTQMVLDFISRIPEMIGQAFTWLMEKFGEIKTFFEGLPAAVGLALSNFYTTVTTKIGETIAAVIAWFTSLPTSIAYWLGFALGTMINWAEAVWLFLTTTLPMWIGYIVGWFMGLPEQIATWLTEVYNRFVTWGTNTWNYLSAQVTMMIANMVKFISELPGKIWTWLVALYQRFVQWGTDTWNYLSSNIPVWFNQVVAWVKALPGRVWEGLSELAAKIKSRFVEGWNAIVAEISSWPGKLIEWGKKIAEAFVNGVKEGLKALVGAFQDGFNKARGSVEGQSPPKEGPLKNIDQWGYNIGMAWVDGFREAIGGLSSIGDQLGADFLRADISGFDPALAGVGGQLPQNQPTTVVNQDITNVINDEVDVELVNERLEYMFRNAQ